MDEIHSNKQDKSDQNLKIASLPVVMVLQNDRYDLQVTLATVSMWLKTRPETNNNPR